MIKYAQKPTLRAVAPLCQMLIEGRPNSDKWNFGDFIKLREGDVFCVLGDVTFGEVSFYAVLTQHSGIGYIVTMTVLSLSDIIA